MDKIYVRHGEFTDFNGGIHSFTVAAVVTNEPELYLADFEGNEDDNIIAAVSLGIAICNPNDTMNAVKGEQIAVGRARKYFDHALVINSEAMRCLINDDAINNLLKNECEFIKNHIGMFIPGYDEKAKKHQQALQEQAIRESLTIDEQIVLKTVETIGPECKALLKKML